MRFAKRPFSKKKQGGSVAVEAALVFAFLTTFLGFPSVLFAFYFFDYSAAQKAAHDAALYLSTAPKLETMTVGPDGGPVSLYLAKTIVSREMAGLTSAGSQIDPGFVCGYQQTPTSIAWKPCTATNNQTLVQLAVSVDMSFANPLTGDDTGWFISAYAPVRYVGN